MSSVRVMQMYGFEGEVTSKYNKEMMRLFTDIFQWWVVRSSACVLGLPPWRKRHACAQTLIPNP